MLKSNPILSRELKLLQQELFDLTANNSFMQVQIDKLWLPDEEKIDEIKAKKVIEKSKYNKKEYALHTCLCVDFFIEWQDQKSKRYLLTPLVYRPCEIIEKKRISTTYEVEILDDIFVINPVLRKVFFDQFNVQLPEDIYDSNEFIASLVHEFSSQKQKLVINDKLEITNSWQLIDKKGIGNFNYRKSQLYKDYEIIIDAPNESIKSLFADTKFKSAALKVKSPFIEQLNDSQQCAVTSSLSNHLVIQGPPGTGKSHTVVAIIEALLEQNKKILFVSEKRSALDIVYNRLKKDKLENQIAYFNTDKDEKKNYYTNLKKSWLDTSDSANDKINPSDLFQLEKTKYPNFVLAKSTTNKISVYELEQHILGSKQQPVINSINGIVPNYNDWKDAKPILQRAENLLKSNLYQSCLPTLTKHILGESNPIQNLAKHLNQLKNNFDQIEKIAENNHLQTDYKTITQYAIAASILGMVNKNQLILLAPDHKQFKLFNRLSKKYELTKNKLKQVELLNNKWDKKPSVAELPLLISALKQKKKSTSIFSVLKRNSAKSNNYFAEFGAQFSDIEKLQMLEDIRTEWHLKGQLGELKIKLKHELQITHPDTEIDQIIQIRNKLNTVTSNEYLTLLESNNSLQLIEELKLLHPLIQKCNNLMSYIFTSSYSSKLSDIQNRISKTLQELPCLENNLNEIKKLLELPVEVLNFVRKNNFSIHELDFLVTLQTLKNETRFSSFYKNLSGNNLLENFKKNQLLTIQSTNLSIAKIKSNLANSIKEKEILLETPSSKLKKNQKEAKQNYKNEKRILLHELSKKQRHLPIKNLLESTSEVTTLLQPVWVMNTLSVAQHLPCKPDIFDYAIFDESSQIPLEDALPTVYRAKKIIVVGDEKQMPPNQFFSSKTQVQTLLDKAEAVFPSQLLKWHYRSEHPALIAFSNRHFYDNELITFPAVSAEYPIKLIKLNGTFENNTNVIEAKAVAKYYQQLLHQQITKIAIIAFSKAQQIEIQAQINLLKLAENSTLILRNLENVQGIESDVVLISIGYAPNEKGKFLKNFGPVNQENGANRLNVLFTRAKKNLVVFSSISSHDFKLSNNTGVHILQKFLAFVEKNSAEQKSSVPHDIAQKQIADLLAKNNLNAQYLSTASNIAASCFVQFATKKILLVNPCLLPNETTDIYALLHAITTRFSRCKIVLNSDLIQNRNQTEKEIIAFFK